MKIDITLFLFFLFNIIFIHAHDAVDIQNITTSQLLPIQKIECTTDELFNKKSERKDVLFSPHENESWSKLPATQLLKDFHVRKTPTINSELFVPPANHTLYDFSQMEPNRAPQNIGLNFTAFRHTECPLPVGAPPDIMLAVGPTQIITCTNMGVVSYDKATGLRDHIIESTLPGFANFFQYSTDFLYPPETTDPHIRYDQFTDRWFFVCISYAVIVIEDTLVVFLPNSLLIAVSDSGIITKTTKWTAYNFPAASIFPPGDFGLFADFPTPGIDANALYIGVNMSAETVATHASLFVFPKSGFINGNPVGTAFRNFVGLNAPHGVDNFDPAPPFGFFISTPISQVVAPPTFPQNTLYLITISNPGTAPLLTSIVPIIVDPWNFPPNAPHKGNVLESQGLGRIAANDDRLWMAHIRNNQLFTTHNIGVDSTGSSLLIPDRTALRWYQIDVANPLLPSVIQQGTFFDSSLINPRFFLFPAIMTNARGDLSLSCSTSAADQFIDALTMGRFAFDPPGTLQAPLFLTNSTSSYNDVLAPTDADRQRWGDYSYTALDPSDQMTMWTAQEFCAQTDNWGMQIAQLLAP